jgi:glutaminase
VNAYVSTGRLPPAEDVQAWMDEAHARFASNTDGHRSRVYPALAAVPPELFGICVAGVSGRQYAAGDADTGFAIMSVAKPFVLALVSAAAGSDAVRDFVGVDPTGLAFNSLEAIERRPDGRTNPMVNGGALATTSLASGESAEAKWSWLLDGLSRFAGRALELDAGILASARATSFRNRSIAQLLAGYGRLACGPEDAVELYTRQSCLSVTARDLAVMGATLADGGVNPITCERVIGADVCHHVLAVMVTAGFYESSGEWFYDTGLPGKSGIGGGIVTVSPGKGGLGVFAPPLDRAGNSVKGRLVARHLSRRLGLDLRVSRPA